MNVATVKTGRRGRPPYRRFNGVISETLSGGWDFYPADPDLFGHDHVHLEISGKLPVRVHSRILSVLNDGRDCEVTIVLTGQSFVGPDGLTYHYFRFVGFPSWVK